jgi:hypothetical protein
VDKVTAKLTVFFEEHFWVGVFESSAGEMLKAANDSIK